MTKSNSKPSDTTSDMEFGVAVASAQAAVAGLSDKYIGWVNDDLKRLDAAIAGVTDGSNAQALREVYGVAHDIKGQGSTFGYHLITDIGQLLCRYTERAIERKKVDRAVIDAHVEALRTVVDNRIQGPAGELGREIIDALKGVAERSFA
jgi:hypothetical protein